MDLDSFDVEQVVTLLRQWDLDKVMADTFRAQGINGQMLLVMEKGDFDANDFPQTRPFHWRVFWSNLAAAKGTSVVAAQMSSVASVVPAPPPIPPTAPTASLDKSVSLNSSAKFVGGYTPMDSTKHRKAIAPIHNLAQHPDIDLSTALEMIKKECVRLDHPYPKGFDLLSGNVYTANLFAEDNWHILGPKYGKRGMTKQRAAFLNFYTHESPFYPIINRLLREQNREQLIPFKPFLKCFLQACYCLPLHPTSVKRGVKLNLKDHFEVGKEVPWWSITSTTDNISVLQSNMFLGSSGPRTMFDITARSLVAIKEFSSLTEEEIILLPGTILQVIGVLDAGGGLVIIQMKEKEPFVPLLDFIHPQLRSASVSIPDATTHPTRAPAAPQTTFQTPPAASADPQVAITAVVEHPLTPSALVGILRDNIDNRDICLTALTKGRTDFNSWEAQDVFTAAGACAVVVSCLRKHAAHADITELGLVAVTHLTSKGQLEAKKQFTAAGACAVVMSCLRRHEAHVAVVKHGLLAIGSLAINNAENQKQFIAAGACAVVISCLHRHEVDRAVAAAGMLAIGNLASKNAAAKKQLTAAGACVVVMSCLRQHEAHVMAIRYGMSVIASLAINNAEIQKQFIAAGACAVAMSCLRRHEADADVMDRGMRAIARLLTKNAEAKKQFTAAGACAMVMSCLRRHEAHGAVATGGMIAMGNLSAANAEGLKQFIAAGACAMVMSCLRRHEARADTAMGGMIAIGHLASKNAEAKQQFTAAGACVVVMSCLRRHETRVDTAKHVLLAIGSLASNNAEFQKQFAAAGACAVVMSCLRQHEANGVLAAAGMIAIGHLASKNAEAKKQLTAAGACAVVMSCLRRHESHAMAIRYGMSVIAEVAKNGMLAITNLSTNNVEAKERFIAAGACAMVISCLRRHKARTDVKDCALRAMATLSAANAVAKKQFTAAGACAVVIACLRLHVTHVSITARGMLAMSKLSGGNAEAKKYFTASGACALVVSCLRRHGVHTNVAEGGMLAMIDVSGRNAEAKKQFTAAGACAVVMSCLRQHEAHAGVIKYTLWAIANLVAKNYDSKKQFLAAGACDVLLSCIRRYAANPDITHRGLSAMHNLSTNNAEAKKKFIAAGACALLVSCLRRHEAHSGIAQEGLWVMETFSREHAEAIEQLASAGAVAAIDSAMARHQGVKTHAIRVREWLVSQIVCHKGWLGRKSRWLKQVRKRFFVLKDATLTTYLQEPKSLSDYKNCVKDSFSSFTITIDSSVKEDPKTPNSFTLTVEEETSKGKLKSEIFFEAEDSRSKKQWVQALRKCIADVQLLEDEKAAKRAVKLAGYGVVGAKTAAAASRIIRAELAVREEQETKKTCRVQIPSGAKPGQIIEVTADDGRRYRLKIPKGKKGGDYVEMTYTSSAVGHV